MITFKAIKDNGSGNIIKLVPNEKYGGVLDPRAREELLASQHDNSTSEETNDIPDIATLRDMMGWPNAKDIATHDLTITNTATDYGVQLRTYVKTALLDKQLPVIFFYHGGGFFGGSLDNVDKPARALADLADVLVVSVDWALAPEHPYPEGFIEAYQTIIWVLNQSGWSIDKHKVTVLGDSAGGGFVYGLGLLDRAFGVNAITKLVAFYPVTYQAHDTHFEKWFIDTTRYPVADDDRELLLPYLTGFFGGEALIDQLYIQENDANSIYLSPFLANDRQLAELPESLTIIGEYDPLRFQGEAFVEKVRLSGGQANYVRYNGMTHAFMDKVGDFPQADDALREAASFAAK